VKVKGHFVALANDCAVGPGNVGKAVVDSEDSSDPGGHIGAVVVANDGAGFDLVVHLLLLGWIERPSKAVQLARSFLLSGRELSRSSHLSSAALAV
jgi:hypothetical protein